MEAHPSTAPLPGARRVRIGVAWVAALALLAYLPLLQHALRLSGAQTIEGWLFRPSQLPPLLVLAVAGWMLWRRRARFAQAVGRAPAAAALAASLGGALYVWALLTRTADLFLPSLALNGLAFAAAARGVPGLRAALLPACVLLLGVRMPAPLEGEVVWHLQLWTTRGAAWLLGLTGEAFVHGGVILRNAEHTFHVIDGCSGFSGIQILLLVSLIVRELFADAGARPWIAVLLAPPLGFALNLVRIAAIAASPDPESLAGLEGDHTPQGIAVLAVGTALLYALGWAASRGPRRETGTAETAPHSVHAGPWPWRAAAVWLAGLALASFVLPPFEAAGAAERPGPPIAFPESGSDWTSERLIADPYFISRSLGPGQMLHRRYTLRGAHPDSLRAVELFVGTEWKRSPDSSSLLSSKLTRPGPGWIVEDRTHSRIWVLERDADFVTATRPTGEERAVLYHWRPRHEGLLRESARALLALESSPLRRAEPRRVVQLVSFARHDGPLELDRAKQRIDRFVLDFRDALSAL